MRDQDTTFRPSRFRYFLFLFLVLAGFAVHEAEGQEIQEIEEYVQANNLQVSDPFMDLRYGSAGIIEITAEGTILSKNPNAKNLVISSSDLSSLPSEPGKFGSVQFMQINRGEAGSFSLSHDQLVSFPGLQYVLILSPTALSKTQIAQMLTGFEESGIVILYQISRPG